MPLGQGVLGRFEEWAAIMGGILDLVGVRGFLANRERLYTEADSEGEEWRAFGEAWWERFGDEPVTAGDLYEMIKESQLLMDLWAGRSRLSGQQRLGHGLAQHRDRVHGRFMIRGAGRDAQTGSAAYRLQRSPEPENPGNPGNLRPQVYGHTDKGDVSTGPPRETPQNPGAEKESGKLRTGASGFQGFYIHPQMKRTFGKRASYEA